MGVGGSLARISHPLDPMNRCWLGLLTALIAIASGAGADCSLFLEAHERLLKRSFSVRREMTLEVNGKIKHHQVAELSYDRGRLETEVLEETRSKSVGLDGGEGDPALEHEALCLRLTVADDGSYRLRSEDGLEEVHFVLDHERRTLVPVAWTLAANERLLFKKFRIRGRAEYSALTWR